MPNQTFFNLPENKRQAIIDCAIAEFAAHDYDIASISNIVKQAKIAKGSFYQYFENKKDLYLYLIGLASQTKTAFLRQAKAPKADADFFGHLRWLFSMGIQFKLRYPALNQITNRLTFGDIPFREEVLQKTREATSDYLLDLVIRGQQQGDVDADLDPYLAVYAIQSLSSGLTDLIPQRLGKEADLLVSSFPADVNTEALEHIFDDVIRVLKRGIGSSNT